VKGSDVSSDWRTMQLFLSEDGVHEVEVTSDDSKKLRCTCRIYKQGKRCKHMRYVREKMEQNNGNYSIFIPDTVTDEEIDLAASSPKAFRDMLIKYSPIEFLP